MENREDLAPAAIGLEKVSEFNHGCFFFHLILRNLDPDAALQVASGIEHDLVPCPKPFQNLNHRVHAPSDANRSLRHPVSIHEKNHALPSPGNHR